MFPILVAGTSADGAALPAFVVARDGVYLRKQTLLGESQTRVERVAHLPAQEEYVDYALPKVPADLMARVVGFFRAVYRLHRTEALVLLTWEDTAFSVHVPAQRVSGSSVKFTLSEDELPPDHGSRARSTRTAPSAPSRARSTRPMRPNSTGCTSWSVISTDVVRATRRRSRSTAIASRPASGSS